jgi:UDP-glucose 4-epimerase
MTKPKILITGGAGFIGSHIAHRVKEKSYEIVVFDNLSRGHQSMTPDGKLVVGELTDPQALDDLFAAHRFEAVMHFAALIDVGESVKNPALYYHNNVAGTLALLQAMTRHRVNKLIFSSTAAVYGTPKADMIEEGDLCNPVNPYGMTKWMVENILDDFDKAYGLKSYRFRYFNAAGGDPQGKRKNFQTTVTNLIPLALRNLINNKEVTINGTDYPTFDGTCVRDYIHIDDLAAAHLKGLENLMDGSETAFYNLGNSKGHSVREVLSAIEKVTGRSLKIVEGKRRAGDPPTLVANAQKAYNQLQWRPHYTLEEMIDHAWKSLI